jgi:hypothetical protein
VAFVNKIRSNLKDIFGWEHYGDIQIGKTIVNKNKCPMVSRFPKTMHILAWFVRMNMLSHTQEKKAQPYTGWFLNVKRNPRDTPVT